MDILEKIIEAKEKIGDDAAIEIAKYLGIENFDEKNLKGCCPFHHEDTPSFIWNKKDKMFKCFGCQRRYGVLDMYTDIEGSYNKALEKLFERTGIKFDSRELKIDRNDFFERYRYPKEEPDRDKSNVYEYYKKRGISKATIDYAGVKEDVHKNCVFELRDLDGELLAVKYRPSHKIKDGEPKMWWQKNADTCPCLYNINKVDITKPILFVEGYSDVLAVLEAGYKNVVSIPGGAEDLNWIEFNYELLENIEQIILWFDNDRAGEIGRKQAQQRLGEYKCKIVKPSKEDIESVHQYYSQYGADCQKTDANNILLACGKDRIINLIENAEDIPVENMIDLMTVEEFDIEKTGYTPTGIAELDKQIYGYIDGSLNIWTAYSGVGKTTTIAQTCVLEAVDKNQSVFWFNAESTTSQMLNWLLSQAAGRQHMIEFKREDGFCYYKPTLEAVKAIKKKYSNKIYVYDNLLLSSADDVLNKMKYMYKKRGTKVFILDNWLCLNFRGKSDAEITGIQVDFMNDLIHFAKRNNLQIHLVAHPRKPQANMPLTEYDILGSSNIVNMADRIYGLEKVWDDTLKPEGFDRQFTVFKDRILGVKGQRIGLRYDKVTRRLYSDTDDKYRKYSWDDGSIKYNSNNFGKNGVLVGNRKLDFEKEPEDMPY